MYGSGVTHASAVPGSTTIVGAGDPIVNGNNTDTGTGSSGTGTCYCKSTVYGYGIDASGVQQTPSSTAGNTGLSVTTGSNGAVTSASGAWSSWQSLQADRQFIVNGITPPTGHAGLWYFLLSLYSGPGMLTSSAITPVLTFSYTWV